MAQQTQPAPASTGDRVKDGLDSARTKAVAGAEQNPLALLVGGVAAGALAGALIPRSAREKTLLKPLGARLGAVAGAALVAAREAGRNELNARGLTADGARDKARAFFADVGQAASSAGTAAAQSARAEATGKPADAPASPAPAANAGAGADDAASFNAGV